MKDSLCVCCIIKSSNIFINPASISNRLPSSLASINTSQVTELTNLYFTDARSRAALSFAAGSGAYNSTTGVITIPTNNNQITNGSNFITLTSLSAGAGISYNNTTGAISSTITQYTDALARASISLTTTGTSGAATYNSTTGILNVPNYGSALSGYLPLTGGTLSTSNSTETLRINNSGSGYALYVQTNSYFQGDLTLQGSLKSAFHTFILPNASGTLALTSNLSAYLPLSGGTLTGALSGTSISLSQDINLENNKYIYAKKSSGATTFNILGINLSDKVSIDATGMGTVFGGALSGTSATFSSSVTVNGDNSIFTGGTANNFNTFPLGIANTKNLIFVSPAAAQAGGRNWSGGIGANASEDVFLGAFNNLSFGAGSLATRMTILGSNGNVLIGTTTDAGYKLDVNGSGRFATSLSTTGGTRSIEMRSYSADWSYMRSNGSPLVFGTQDANTLYIRTNDTDRLTIASSGQVGIGNTIPNTIDNNNGSGTLVVGSGSGSQGMTIYSGSASGNEARLTFANSSSGGGAYAAQITYKSVDNSILFYNQNAVRMTLNSSGNLGLGVTPSAWNTVTAFQVGSTSVGGYSNTGYLNGNAFFQTSWKYINSSFAARYEINSSDAGIHRWYTAPSGTAGNSITFTEAMTLTAAGELLVGTPTRVTGLSGFTQFEVSGSEGGITINSNTTTANKYSRLMFTKSGATGNEGLIRYNVNDYHMAFWTNATEQMRIFSNGNVGINSQTDSGYKLDVNGTGRFSGAFTGASATFSDTITSTGNATTSTAHIFNNCKKK